MLAEAFCDFDSMFSAQVKHIHHQCFNLLNAVLSYSEQNISYAHDDFNISLIDNKNHLHVIKIYCLNQKYVIKVLQLSLWFDELRINNFFLNMLWHTYLKNYEIINIIQFLCSSLQWCQKVIFTDQYEIEDLFLNVD